jgi:hypothetical protein|eukprot:COSAG02_NODE_184_length_30545_cov_128.634402_17_plen_139_part_00
MDSTATSVAALQAGWGETVRQTETIVAAARADMVRLVQMRLMRIRALARQGLADKTAMQMSMTVLQLLVEIREPATIWLMHMPAHVLWDGLEAGVMQRSTTVAEEKISVIRRMRHAFIPVQELTAANVLQGSKQLMQG